MNNDRIEVGKSPASAFVEDNGSGKSVEREEAIIFSDEEKTVLTEDVEPSTADSEELKAAAEEKSAEQPAIPERRLDDARIAELLANPMFIRFARGRSGGIETVCREFEDMLAVGGQHTAVRMTAPVAAKIVPAVASATPDVALSERQRAIARTAGMSYREYYELISELPGSTNQNYKGE